MEKPVYLEGFGELVHVTKFGRMEGLDNEYFIRVYTGSNLLAMTAQPDRPHRGEGSRVVFGRVQSGDRLEIPISEDVYTALKEKIEASGQGYLKIAGQLEFIVEKTAELVNVDS